MWKCSPRRAAAQCGRWNAGFGAAAIRTGPACSRSSGRPGETTRPSPQSPSPFGLATGDCHVPGVHGAVGAHLAGSCPGRVGYGAGGSILVPPSPRCPSEDHLLPFSSWRFTFYLIAFIAGMAVIVDVSTGLSCTWPRWPPSLHLTPLSLSLLPQKPWFYDLREVWKGYPIQVSTCPHPTALPAFRGCLAD